MPIRDLRSSNVNELDTATLTGTELIAVQVPGKPGDFSTTATAIAALAVGGGTGPTTNPVSIAQGGTGQATAVAGLTALGGMGRVTRTAVKTAATYTAAVGDLVPVDTTSNSVTVTLPTAPATGSVVEVRHIIAGAGNTVTIACGGSDTFSRASGPTTAVLTLAGQTGLFQYDSGSATWTPIGPDLPLSQLDLRYLTPTINNQVGTSYTLVLADAGTLVTLSNASAIALTIPANASVAFPVNTVIQSLQLGAGQVTVGITSDTLHGTPGLKTRAQYSMATLVKITSTSWIIAGDLSA